MNGLAMYDELDDDQFEESFDESSEDDDDGLCKKCKGNAKYQVRTEEPDGTVSVEWKFCERCDGKGVEPGGDYVD